MVIQLGCTDMTDGMNNIKMNGAINFSFISVMEFNISNGQYNET